jgi:hypothetical protein
VPAASRTFGYASGSDLGGTVRAVFDSHGGEQASPLLLFTDSYKVRGTLRTRRRRLTDVLNAEDAQFLVFEELGKGTTVHRAPYAQVNLSTVLFGVAEEQLDPTPDLKTVKVQQQALISLPPFTIRGQIHLTPEPNLRNALDLLRDRFVPVTDAWFWSEFLDEARTQSPMIAFNHSRAQILAPYEGEADVWQGLGGGTSAARSAPSVPDPGAGTGGRGGPGLDLSQPRVPPTPLPNRLGDRIASANRLVNPTPNAGSSSAESGRTADGSGSSKAWPDRTWAGIDEPKGDGPDHTWDGLDDRSRH